jgi:hypothetical protein
MSAVINNDYQTNLLFKQFTGVAATQLDQQFSNEPYRAIKNIFSRDIFIEEVPTEARISIFNLDNSGDWVDSSGSSPSINSSTSTSFSQIYPDDHIEFYKNIVLTAVPGSNSRVWYKLDSSGNNILADTLNFKFDDINSTYLTRVKYNNGTTYINNAINSYPLFWVLDNQSGYLQLYVTTTQLLSNANIPTNPPKISYFRYVGKKGLLNLDISGQQQVIDISGLDADISNIDLNLNRLNRMILPDGYVDISGTDYDLCGNEVIRTYYTYNRKNMFIGYENLPILDSSAVNHSQDPSHNNIIYELDISGSLYVSNHTQLQDVSCNNLDVSGDLLVLGHTQLQDVSCNNLDVSGDLLVLGHTQLQDVSCNNLDVSGDLLVLGHTQLQDVSCNNLDVSNNIILWGDMSMNGGQITFIGDATDISGVPSWGQVQQAIIDGSGGTSYWLQNVSSIYYNTGNVGIGTNTPSQRLEVSGNVVIDGILDMCCNNINDISNIYFCNNTALLGQSPGILTISGDLDMSMNQIITIADATDPSGVPSWGQVQQAIIDGSGGTSYWIKTGNDLFYDAGDVSVKDTNLIQEATFNSFAPIIAPPATFASLIIASVVKTDAITSGYFTIQLTTQDYQQIIHFISGVVENKTPFIKVLSNTNRDILNGLSNLYIVDNGIDYLLCTNFFSTGAPVDYIKLTLSNNSQNYSVPTSNNINWILQDLLPLPVGPTYTSYVDVSLNLIGGGPYAITSMYEIIDNSFQINKDNILLGNLNINGDIISTDLSGILDISATLVDISGALEVNSYIQINGKPPTNNDFALDVCGNSIFGGKVIVDISGGNNEGITIQNIGSAGPQLRFVDNHPTFIGTTTYKNIYVDGTTDDLNIDIGSDDLFINASNSTLSQLKVKQANTGTTLIGIEKGSTTMYLFQTGTRGGLELNNGISGDGLRFQCGGFSEPQHIWYIGATNQSASGNAIIVKGLTELANNFQSGEVAINYYSEDIDFSVGTTDTSHCLFVDASLNTININSPMYVNNNLIILDDVDVSGNLSVDGILDISGELNVDGDIDICGNLTVQDLSATNISVSNNLDVDGLITGIADTTFVEYRNFSTDISGAIGPDWYCIATCESTQDNARGLFIIDDDTSGIREQIIFYAGTSYARGNYVNVLAHNWYMSSGPLTSNIKIDVSGNQPTPGSPAIYAGANLYIYRLNNSNTTDIRVRLYQNGREVNSGGRWVLTSTPIVNLNTTAVDLDLTYNPNNRRANACSSLDHSFQGDVSMNTLNLSNLDVQNTITTKILEVEDSGGNDVLKVDGPNKTSTFYFDSSGPSNSLILKDTNGNTSTFIKQQGTTVVMEGSDLQVGSVGVEKDINAAEVTGWFNTRDYYAIAVASASVGTSAEAFLGYTSITNDCPGGVKIIPTTGTTIYIEPPATGVYTINVTGIWNGDAWGSGDHRQPLLTLRGPPYYGSTNPEVISQQGATRFVDQAGSYVNYMTFNWTGRMVETYGGSQAQYLIYAKNNGGATRTYNGKIQVTRIC